MYLTIPEFLEKISEKYSTKTALQIRRFLRTTKYSYKEVCFVSNKIAGYLIENGLKKGDFVIILAPNMPEWVLAFLGSLCAGLVIIPVGIHSSPELIGKYIKQTNPKLIFMSKFYPVVLNERELSNLKKIFLEEIIDLTKNVEIRELPRIKSDELAEVVFTSGTTGEPKGVMISHHNILYEIEELLKVVPKYKEFRLLSVLPLSHVMEQIVGVFIPLARGGTVYYIPRINALTIQRALRKYQITDLGVVPQLLRMFLDTIEYQVSEQKRDIIYRSLLKISPLLPFPFRRILFGSINNSLGGKLDILGTGSAPLDLRLASTWEAIGIKIVEGYGASETTGAVSANRVNERKLGSVGKKLSGMEIKISSDGEIIVKGENITKGYYNNEVKTKAAFTKDGYYKTEDIGYFDKDGYLYISGREKFKIITASGDKIFPEDIERKINNHPSVWDSCVFGLKKNDGEVVYACLILKNNSKTNLDIIIKEINQKLEGNQQIFEYSLWPEKDFPRLHTLKVDRSSVKSVIGQEIPEDKSRARQDNRQENKDILKEIISKTCKVKIEDIKESNNLLNDFGLDSLKRVELVSIIEEEFGVEISETQINSKATVHDLRNILKVMRKIEKPKEYPSWVLSPIIVELRDFFRRIILFPLIRFIAPTEIINKQNLSLIKSPGIIIFNHVGHFDATTIINILPTEIRKKQTGFADSKLYSNFVVSFIMYFLGSVFPLNKWGGSVKHSLEFAADLLENGWLVLISPEGNISDDGNLKKFKNGVAVLALQTGVPVYPFKIDGYRKIYPRKKNFPFLPEGKAEISIKVGKPLSFNLSETTYEKATAILHRTLYEL